MKTENYHNSRTSDNIKMKLVTATKLDKGNKGLSKIGHDALSENREVIVVFPIYGQFKFRTRSL